MRSQTMACITKSRISTVPWVAMDQQFTAHACTAHTGTTLPCYIITTPYEQYSLHYSNMRVERESSTVIKVTDSLFHVPHTYAMMWKGWTSRTGNSQNPKHSDFILWRHTCIVQNPQHKTPWNTGQWWPGHLPLIDSEIKMQNHKRESTDMHHQEFCISFKKFHSQCSYEWNLHEVNVFKRGTRLPDHSVVSLAVTAARYIVKEFS